MVQTDGLRGLSRTDQRSLGIEGDTFPDGLLTRERQVVFNLNPLYGSSVLRDLITETGNGTVTSVNSEFVLATTANGGDEAEFESGEHARYVPGYAAEVGIGVRLQSIAPTGNQVVTWGLDNGTDGLYFGRDATGMFVAIKRAGSETKTYQSDWNVDAMDGSGDSGLTLNTEIGHIFQIRYYWYGYGAIEYAIQVVDDHPEQHGIVVHRTAPTTAGTTIPNPNLPIRAKVDNGGTATAYTAYVAGRQFSILGKYERKTRTNGDYRLQLGSVGTTFLPTVSLRKKSDTVSLSTSIRISGFEILSDAALVWQLRQNASLTGASWGALTDTSAGETKLEADIAATAVTGGEVLHSGFAAGGAGNKANIENLDLIFGDFINQQSVTLCVRRVTGTNATVDALLHASEEW